MAVGLRSFLPVSRRAFGLNNVDMGEALLHPSSSRGIDRLPLDPLLEAFGFVHASPPAAKFLVAAFFVAALLLVFALGGLLGSLWSGLLVATVWENHLWSVGMYSGFYKYFFFMPFVLTVVGLMIWRARKPTLARTFLLACAIGSSLLYRSTLAFFPPFLVLYELLFVRRAPPQKSWKHALLLGAAPYLFLLPWVRMNWLVSHQFVPFENGAADVAMVLGALGVVQGGNSRASDMIRALSGGAPISAFAWSLREVARHPVRYAAGCASKLLFVFKLFPLSAILAGFSLWVFRKKEEFRQAGVFLLYFVAIHCLMTVSPDYFEPLWPLLLALAAAPFALAGGLRDFSDELFIRRASERILFAALAAVSAMSLLTARALDAYSARAALAPLGSAAALERELVRSPDEAWLLFDRGTRRLDGGDVDGAKLDLGRALALQPDVPRMKLQFDWAAARNGDPSALFGDPYCSGPAMGAFNDAIAEKACVYQSVVYLRLGRETDARARLTRARELHRGLQSLLDASSPSERRVQEMMHGASDAAFAKTLDYLAPDDRFLVMSELAPPSVPDFDDWDRLAMDASAAGRIELAVKALDRAEASGRERKLPPGKRQNIYRSLSLERLQALASKRPGDYDLRLQLAESNLNSGRIKPAVRAAALVPGRLKYTLRVAIIFRRLKWYRLSLELLRGLTAAEPGDFDAWIERAETALEAGDRTQAEASLIRARALALEPGDLRRLSLSEQQAGDFAAALGILEKLSREAPKDAAVFQDLGVCEYMSGAPEKGAASLETAIRLDPRLLPAYVSLAFIYSSLRRDDDARRIDDRALSVGSGDAALLEMIRQDRAALERKRR